MEKFRTIIPLQNNADVLAALRYIDDAIERLHNNCKFRDKAYLVLVDSPANLDNNPLLMMGDIMSAFACARGEGSFDIDGCMLINNVSPLWFDTMYAFADMFKNVNFGIIDRCIKFAIAVKVAKKVNAKYILLNRPAMITNDYLDLNKEFFDNYLEKYGLEVVSPVDYETSNESINKEINDYLNRLELVDGEYIDFDNLCAVRPTTTIEGVDIDEYKRSLYTLMDTIINTNDMIEL